jgi:hypothetical protein
MVLRHARGIVVADMEIRMAMRWCRCFFTQCLVVQSLQKQRVFIAIGFYFVKQIPVFQQLFGCCIDRGRVVEFQQRTEKFDQDYLAIELCAVLWVKWIQPPSRCAITLKFAGLPSS